MIPPVFEILIMKSMGLTEKRPRMIGWYFVADKA
jgi:hypothetical protein